MSSLRKITIPSPVLPVSVSEDEAFTVRGVGFDDILALYYRHTGALSVAFEGLVLEYQTSGEITSDKVSFLIAKVVQEFPLLAAEFIAVASGSDVNDSTEFSEDVAVARSLPLGVQLSAIEKIFGLTFTSEMPPKKLFALLANQLSTSQAVQQGG